MHGTLSVVGTPIGNLGDITLRAIETLKNADAIACEDTRVTAKLLARYDIEKPLLVYHEASARDLARPVLALLAEGKRVALVTDAGTPGISDPGMKLVAEARAIGARVESVPGVSALATALSVAGLSLDEFVFLGFPPHKKGRQTFFARIKSEPRAAIFYESPYRIEKALAALPAERRVTVCRELTKLHESVVSGTATEVAEYFKAHPGEVRGEFVVIVHPC